MPDWTSSAELAIETKVWINLAHIGLGLYTWEWFTSLPFDLHYLFHQAPFRWPLLFYLANRYTALIALIGFVVALNSEIVLDCQTLVTITQLMGNTAIGFANVSLGWHTITLWDNHPYVLVPLVLILLGQWPLLLHALPKAEWNPTSLTCVTFSNDSEFLSGSFIYTVILNVLLIVLTTWRLFAKRRTEHHPATIAKIFWRRGLVYFVMVCIFNALATAFVLLNLNTLMQMMGYIPAVTASSICAGRITRKVSNLAIIYSGKYLGILGTEAKSPVTTFGSSLATTTAGTLSMPGMSVMLVPPGLGYMAADGRSAVHMHHSPAGDMHVLSFPHVASAGDGEISPSGYSSGGGIENFARSPTEMMEKSCEKQKSEEIPMTPLTLRNKSREGDVVESGNDRQGNEGAEEQTPRGSVVDVQQRDTSS